MRTVATWLLDLLLLFTLPAQKYVHHANPADEEEVTP